MADVEACDGGQSSSNQDAIEMAAASTFVADGSEATPPVIDSTTEPTVNETPVRLTSAGYQKLADMMAAYPAGAIFRRFGSLYVRRVLHLQAELIAHEEYVKGLAEEDYRSPDSHRQRYCRDYFIMKYGHTDKHSTDKNNDQYRAWTEIDLLLKRYSEAVEAARDILGMEEPDKHDLEYLKRWMFYKGHVVLTGVDHDVWDKTPVEDLMVLREHLYDDHISQWINETAIPRFNKVLGRHVKKREAANGPLAGTWLYQPKWMGRTVSTLAVSLASLQPILAIVVLHRDLSDSLKMGLMGLFTVVFSLALAWFSGAKKTEIFAASAAFAAVQVVFVSGDSSRCKT